MTRKQDSGSANKRNPVAKELKTNPKFKPKVVPMKNKVLPRKEKHK